MADGIRILIVPFLLLRELGIRLLFVVLYKSIFCLLNNLKGSFELFEYSFCRMEDAPVHLSHGTV